MPLLNGVKDLIENIYVFAYLYTYNPKLCTTTHANYFVGLKYVGSVCRVYDDMSTLKTLSKQSFDNLFS